MTIRNKDYSSFNFNRSLLLQCKNIVLRVCAIYSSRIGISRVWDYTCFNKRTVDGHARNKRRRLGGKYAGPGVFIQIQFDTRKTSVRVHRARQTRETCVRVVQYVRAHQLSALGRCLPVNPAYDLF